MRSHHIHELLERIDSGQDHFSPKEERPETDRQFQSTVKTLKAMEKAGLIGKVSTRNNRGVYLAAKVTDGLTFEGEQTLAKARAGVVAKMIGWCVDHGNAILVGIIIAVVSGLLLATCG